MQKAYSVAKIEHLEVINKATHKLKVGGWTTFGWVQQIVTSSVRLVKGEYRSVRGVLAISNMLDRSSILVRMDVSINFRFINKITGFIVNVKTLGCICIGYGEIKANTVSSA